MSDSGETTSHLMGMFYRTLRMVDNGIKPLYVFDGARLSSNPASWLNVLHESRRPPKRTRRPRRPVQRRMWRSSRDARCG